mmetsp:Transcript_28175/g.48610  ORF Transcript_28175/g.48610 Transcript_28175/m.48610 type:complete len:404 (-) Transcript_28175:212-1423(-)
MASGILRAGKYNSAAAQTRAVTALSEPLIPSKRSSGFTDTDSDSEEDEEEGILLDSAELPPKLLGKDIVSTLAVSLLVTGGLAASAAAMISIPSAIIFMMGGICIINSPTVAHKHLGIAKNEGLRTSLGNIRKEVDLLTSEIDFLTHSVDDLQAEADVLVGLEQDLQDIATKQGKNVNDLIDLVNENELILSEMKGNLRQTFVAAIAKVVMVSDKDGDMKIDSKELPLLSLRLQIQLEPYGIKLATNKFEAMILEDNDISNVMKFCGDMLFEGDSNDSQDDDSVDSEVTFDFESFCRTLDDEHDTMTFEEKVGMVTVDEKFSKGSVEVARGKRMTLVRSTGKTDMHRKTIVKEVKKRQTILAARRSQATHLSKRPNTRSPGRRDSHFSFSSGHVMTKGTSAEF